MHLSINRIIQQSCSRTLKQRPPRAVVVIVRDSTSGPTLVTLVTLICFITQNAGGPMDSNLSSRLADRGLFFSYD